MTNKTSLKQILSTGLSLALVAASSPMPASAFGPVEATAPAFAAKLMPPEQFGYVASSFASNNEDKPRIVLVSDLHAHVEVQHNIMGILEDIVPKLKGLNGKQVPIFLEGGWEANLQEPLNGMSDPQTRKFFDEYYLQKSELGGPQAYSEKIAGSNQITMIGVEDKEEYLANKTRFAKTYPARRQLLEAIKMQETAMRLLSDEVEGGAFKKVQSMRDDYNAGRLQADRYAKALVRYADRYHIEGRYVDVLRHSSTAAQNELDAAFVNVYRDVSIRLSEKRPLTAFLRKQLGNEANIRKNLASVDSDLDLLKRLISNQLTPSEVTLAMARMGALIQVAKALLDGQIVTVDIADVIRQSLDFYPLAFVRNDTLIKNSLAWLDKAGPDMTGILVVGGFHTDAISTYLAERKIPYMVINPTITRDLTTEEQLNYVKRMCGDHVTSEEVESDVEWLKTSRQKTMDALSSGSPVTAAKENVVQPDVPGTGRNDTFAGGLKPEVRADLSKNGVRYAGELAGIGLNVGDNATVLAPQTAAPAGEAAVRLAAVQRHIDALAGQNGMQRVQLNTALPGRTLYYSQEGHRYVEVGRKPDDAPTIFEQIAAAQLAAMPKGTTPKDTLYVQAVGTRDQLVDIGAESRFLDPSDGTNEGSIPIALDRFLQLEAIDNAPAATAGSPEEAHRMMAVHTLSHEIGESLLPNASEHATTAHGWAVAAVVVENRFGVGSAQRFAAVAPAQFSVTNVAVNADAVSSRTLAEGISEIMAPKAQEVTSVVKLANLFASTELVSEDPAALQAELTAMQRTMEYRMALLGFSAPLLKKVRLAIAAKAAEAAAA